MRTFTVALLFVCAWFASTVSQAAAPADKPEVKHLLYVAVPGIRNDLAYGGHGVLVFDIDRGHKFVRRIAAGGVNAKGEPLNVKGVCASAATGRLYVSTLEFLTCYNLASDKQLWERRYDGGCDRMSISPDGKRIFLPSLEGPHWNIVDGESGDVVEKVVTGSGAHNTVCCGDGSHAYLAGLHSPLLSVLDAKTLKISGTVGPFAAAIRPFTVNSEQSLCFVNVNELLGFEVGDIKTGKKLYRVEVEGFKPGPVKRHGCPSHGVGLTPDEKQVWVTDASNRRLHVFDVAAASPILPPKLLASIELRDEPGWVTFNIDGRYAYPSTGDVIDVATRRIVAELTDETGAAVQSEKLLEIDFAGGKPVAAGDQFGVGRATHAGVPKSHASASEIPSAELKRILAWQKDIDAFKADDAKHPFAKHGIVFVGSSSIRLWDLAKSFPEAPMLNRGFGGSHMMDSAFYVNDLVVKHAPRIVVVYAGDNDVAAGKSPADVAGAYGKFVANIRSALPETEIVYLGIKPSIARWKLIDKFRQTNRRIRELTKTDSHSTYVDTETGLLGPDGQPRKELFRDDGLHLNEAGYKIWTGLVAPLLDSKAAPRSP